MAVADMTEYLAKCAAPWQKVQVTKDSLAVAGGLPYSYWTQTPFAGAAPTTAAVPTMATAGAVDSLTRFNPGADLWLAKAQFIQSAANMNTWVLCDRLSHQGGLSGTVTTVDVTTNLPTAALTRYATGAGVMAAIEIYSTLGATATTITCKYTNQAGTGGQVSQPVAIGSSTASQNVAKRWLPINLAAGDTGIRSIESSTLLASTLTAGNFGYCLYKPLAMFCMPGGVGIDWNAMLGGAGNLVEIQDNACLFWLARGNAATSVGELNGELGLIEA